MARMIADEERKLKQQKTLRQLRKADSGTQQGPGGLQRADSRQIRSNIVLPADIRAIPSALFKVVQLPFRQSWPCN